MILFAGMVRTLAPHRARHTFLPSIWRRVHVAQYPNRPCLAIIERQRRPILNEISSAKWGFCGCILLLHTSKLEIPFETGKRISYEYRLNSVMLDC